MGRLRTPYHLHTNSLSTDTFLHYVARARATERPHSHERLLFRLMLSARFQQNNPRAREPPAAPAMGRLHTPYILHT